MLKVAIVVLLVSIPTSWFLWLRWMADRRKQNVSNATVQALVDDTLGRAKADREKIVPKETST